MMQKYVLHSDAAASASSLPKGFEQELNPAQLEAVRFNDGPLLVIAGAGSGKTKTLVYRVARLIADGIPPEQILLLTFTRKASQEMLRRASTLLDVRCNNVSGGTFHAFANAVLRKYTSYLGFDSQFTILDRADAEDLIQAVRKELGFDKSDKRFPKKSTIGSIISKCVNTGKSVQEVLIEEYPQFSDFSEDIRRIDVAYHAQKKAMAVFDYDDLLLKLLELLSIPEVQTKLQNRFRYIMVDEYQDTNAIQAEIVCRLANAQHNIMAVGDDSQSIYSFRGANFKNIMSFPKLFPGAKIIRLEENYRSSQPILDLTNAVIARAREKYSKNLFTQKKGGLKPVYVETDSERLQSRFVAQKILELRESGVELTKIAILIRSGWHSNDLEVELKSRNLPFIKLGGFKFMEASHVKDVVSFLRVRFNPADTVAWQRILLLFDGVGPKAASVVCQRINENKKQVANINWADLKTKAYFPALLALFQLIFSPKSVSVPDQIAEIVAFYKPLFQQKYDDYSGRTADLESLQGIAERFSDLETFLTEMSLEPPDGSQSGSEPESQDDEKLTISTIHSAKGMEWHTVFLISAVDGLLPSFQSLGDLGQLEEERRLLYVALTRAREGLFIVKPNMENSSSAFYRAPGFRFSKLCRFLEEGQLLQSLAERYVLVEQDKPRISFSNYNYGRKPQWDGVERDVDRNEDDEFNPDKRYRF